MAMKLLIERVLKTIRNYRMVGRGNTVLVAVSGGPDSVFLMHALAKLKTKLGISNIVVCHLDHGLRGRESAVDAAFVKDAAAELGLRAIIKRVDVRSMRRKDRSIEEKAREARYAFYRAAARACAADVVATGHTLDDQAETIVMRFVKGASLKGLAGIAPSREEGSARVVRPLIELEKREIVNALRGERLAFRVDSSNLGDDYFRNTVRSAIIPFLERYNPRLKRSLSNLAEHLREDLEFISQAQARAAGSISGSAKGGVEIALKDLVLQPRAVQKEVLRDCLERSGGEVKRLSFRHWKELERLVVVKGKGSSVDLPGSIRATRTATAVVFRKR